MTQMKSKEYIGHEIAVIGYAGRFPNCTSVDDFWVKICQGKELITRFDKEILKRIGLSTDYTKENYVCAKAYIEKSDFFDANFFDITSSEALKLDPQHRILLEIAWQALEHAGYVKETRGKLFGVFAGCSANTYSSLSQETNPVKLYQMLLAGDKDMLATRLSYLLDLHGPSMSIQTACSTSLVNLIVACQQLNDYSCDLALAGGVSLTFPEINGYTYVPGMILSPDGYNRTFDKQAQGTVPANGAGLVVLKRLSEALDDNDTIHAVIRGWGLNNDGHSKSYYTAPSVKGQAEAIALAQALAEVHPEEIGYIEAHGTATELGDPIEIEALTKAFRVETSKKSYCAIGSVKSNVGHMDTAAGICGFIKAMLAVKHGKIPPSLHYQQSNQNIDFESSPFFVATKLLAWNNQPSRIAGISSFGIGGTNAHVIIEQPPEIKLTENKPSIPQLFVFSAKTEESLRAYLNVFCEWLNNNNNASFADISFTLQCARLGMPYRAFVLTEDSQPNGALLKNLLIHQTTRSLSNNISLGMEVIENQNLEKIHSTCSSFPTYHNFFSEIINSGAPEGSFAIITSFIFLLYKLNIRPSTWHVQNNIVFISVLLVNKLMSKEAAIEWIISYNEKSLVQPIHINKDETNNPVAIFVGTKQVDLERLSDEKYLNELFFNDDALDMSQENYLFIKNEGIYFKNDSSLIHFLYHSEGILDLLGNCWSAGLDINWKYMPHQGIGHRIPLPVYEFQREKYSLLKNQIPPLYENNDTDLLIQKEHVSIEAHVKKIWCDVLGRDYFEAEDDWFNLGGSSLQFVELIMAFRNQFVIEIEPKDVISDTSLSAMINLIKTHIENMHVKSIPTTPKPFTLVEINKGKTGQIPLFLMHPVGGNIYNYKIFAGCFSKDIPIYGLQAQALDGFTDPNVSIEQMANSYVNAMKTVYSGRHWIVCGYSFGGNIAYAIAKILEDQNYRVSTILIDSSHTSFLPDKFNNIYEFAEYVIKLTNPSAEVALSDLREMSNSELLNYLNQSNVWDYEVKEGKPDELEQKLTLFFKIFLGNQMSMHETKPQCINGDVLYIQALERDTYHNENPSQGWKKLTQGKFLTTFVPGNHLTMMYQPNVQSVAKTIDAFVNKQCIDHWIYQLNWKELAEESVSEINISKDKTFLIVYGEQQLILAEEIEIALSKLNCKTRLLCSDESEFILAEDYKFEYVFYLSSILTRNINDINSSELIHQQKAIIEPFLNLIKKIASHYSHFESKVLVFTKNTEKIIHNDVVNPIASIFKGIIRTIQMELNNCSFTCVDLDELDVGSIVSAITKSESHEFVAVRDKHFFIPIINHGPFKCEVQQ